MVAQGFTMKTKTVFRQSFNTFLSEFLVKGIDLITGSSKGNFFLSDYRAKGPSRHLSRKEKESDLDPRIRSSEMKIELNQLLRGTLEIGSASPMLVGLGALATRLLGEERG